MKRIVMMIEIFRGLWVGHDGAYENYGVLHGRNIG